MATTQLLSTWFLIALLMGCSSRQVEISATDALIPQPIQVEIENGSFTFNKRTAIGVQNDEQALIARMLAELFTTPAGFTPKIIESRKANILFITDTTLRPESYDLEIRSSHVTIKAADKAGFFYAIQSIRMQLPPAIESKEVVNDTFWRIPEAKIQDGPRFPYRGFMLDVARCFLPKETMLKMIDCMAMLKLNRLHLHLVDDNGWRLEIKKYPRLTEIGGWRVHRDTDFAQRKNALPGEATPDGGFYTQEEMKEIITYAAARQVEVIPEIEMPAHTNSSLAAYPELACPVIKDPITVIPGMGAKASEIVYCAGNENVFTFLQNVIDEVAELFPAPYIHLGGDEASKENWKKCPLCQARMKSEDITDIEELQGYFMCRMGDYVRSKGKQVMGWDELTNNELPEGAIIYGWQEMGSAGYKAGQAGHPFIMTPARVLYLIRYQGPQWFEPRTYFGNNTLKDVYDYEPIQPKWEADAAANLIGVQASLWTEFVNQPQDMEYLAFPRLAALAEVAWSPAGSKNWAAFLRRLDVLTRHYDYMEINYATSMFNLDHLVRNADGALRVGLSCIRPDMDIRYTTNGSEPDMASILYADTLEVTSAQTIKAATFSQDGQMGKTLTLRLDWNKATAKPIPNGNEQTYRLVNGLRGSDKHSDFEWCGWHGKDASFTIDLQKEDTIHTVTLGCITNYGMAVHLPRQITLSVSKDDITYSPVARQSFTPKEIFREGIRIEDKTFERLNSLARYLKVDIQNPGICPADHTRPGQDTWVYLDEVIIQ